MSEIIKKPMLSLLLMITDWSKIKRVNEILKEYPLHFCYVTKAEGTASSEILDMFGLGRSDKALIWCVTERSVANDILDDTTEKLLLKSKGAGIGFTVLLTGVATNIMKILNDEAKAKMIDHLKSIETEVEKMKCNTTLTLILSVINQGYSEEVMEAAKSAGANGGTVVNARSLGLHEGLNFFGVAAQAEKELVLIVTDKEKKVEIMKAINCTCGITSEAQGLTISLPVDGAAGLG